GGDQACARREQTRSIQRGRFTRAGGTTPPGSPGAVRAALTNGRLDRHEVPPRRSLAADAGRRRRASGLPNLPQRQSRPEIAWTGRGRACPVRKRASAGYRDGALAPLVRKLPLTTEGASCMDTVT